MATHQGYADLKAKAFFSRPGVAILASLAHTTGDLHKPGETNSVGLVMMGAVEFAGSRDIIPSGTNREYGYWRGQYNRTFIDSFDKAWMPLEGSGMYAGSPVVTVSAGAGTAPDGTVTDCDARNCTWMWSGAEWNLVADFCYEGCECADAPTDPGGFPGDSVGKPCVGGSSSSGASGTGENVGFAKWEKAGALIGPVGREAIQQRSLFLSDRSFINAGSGVDLSGGTGYSIYAKVLPSGNITGTVIIGQHKENPAQFVLGCDYDGSYYIRSDYEVSGVNTPVYAKTTKRFEDYPYPAHVIGVYASGDSKLKIYVNGRQEGESAPFIRGKTGGANTNVTLGKREFAIAERGFTGWIDEAGVSSKSLEGSEIKAFHDGTFNITDLIFNSKVTPISSAQSTATVTITSYTELNTGDTVNIIATDGTNYNFINGDQSSVDGTWESTTSNDQTATNLMNVINTSSGPAGTRFSASVVGAVVTITQNTVGAEGNTAGTLTDSGSAGMTSTNFVGGVQSGLSGRSFGDTGIDALNNDYVELVVDSGVVGRLNPDGVRGGAFDKTLWGQADYAVSSVLTFDLTELPTRFHQLTDLSVDLWVEHSTNHPSGADLSVRLVHKDKQLTRKNLYWHPSGVSIPSGSKRLVSIAHPLEYESYYRDGNPSFKRDFDDHQLEISVKYPKSALPYDAEFKIYSSKLGFSGFDTLAKYNTMTGLTEDGVIKGHSVTDIDGNVVAQVTGDRSLTMHSLGASPTLSSGIMNMFVDVGTADQSLNLMLNHDPQTSMGDTASGFLFANAAIEMKHEGQATGTVTVFASPYLSGTIPHYVRITTTDGTVITATVSEDTTTTTDTDSPTWAKEGSDSWATADNLATCLNANSKLIATSNGAGVVTIKQVAAGPAGDTAIVLEDPSGEGMSKTDFTGGGTPLSSMNLYTTAGAFKSTMPLFLKQRRFTGLSSPSLRLETKGAELSFPRSQKILPLHMLGSPGFGVPSGDMILVMPNTSAPLQFTNRLLYIRGEQPIGDIPLYLEVTKPKIKIAKLFAKGPLAYTPSGIMNMFVKQKDLYGVSYIEALPAIVGNENTSLFTKGHGFLGNIGTQATGTVTIYASQYLSGIIAHYITITATDGTVITATVSEDTTTTTDTNSPTWAKEGSDSWATADNLATCLNANSKLTATSNGAGIVTIKQVVTGAHGNTAIVLEDPSGEGMSKTDFAGGVDPSSLNLVMPNILGSGTKTFNLSTRGYE